MKTILTTLAMLLLAVSPVMAADTTKVYTSGILVLLFVGFCALLVVVQLLPAILSLMGMTEKAAKNVKGLHAAQTKKH